jgi:hypothetical protein
MNIESICFYSYLAGFFDGEGCVFLNKKEHQLHLSIGQKRSEVLFNIQQKLNIGKVYLRKDYNSVFLLWGKDVYTLLKLILPYTIVKKDEIILAIEFYEKFHCNGKKKNRYSESEKIEIELYRVRLQELKR